MVFQQSPGGDSGSVSRVGGARCVCVLLAEMSTRCAGSRSSQEREERLLWGASTSGSQWGGTVSLETIGMWGVGFNSMVGSGPCIGGPGPRRPSVLQ